MPKIGVYMGKANGFLEYERKNGQVISEAERIQNFDEFHFRLVKEEQRLQAARCMDCGIPYCQSGKILCGMTSGCPLNNLVPEMNDLVYHGNYEQAFYRLEKTNCFPEFTSKVCPALCEAACTCGLQGESVATKENERAIVEYAFENGLIRPDKPKMKTGKRVAIIGSGPAGLAAAYHLHKRGHEVTIYERNDRAGGLLCYGIPNMKLDKQIVARRIALMEESGIHFEYGVDVGHTIKGSELLKEYDRVILACGASKPRDIEVPGRSAEGIFFAVDFLSKVTKTLLDSNHETIPYELAKGKSVLVIGGGDTGNDCVGTAIRLGAKSVIQLEMMPMAPKTRTANNTWPEWPKICKTDYGQEEAIYLYGGDPRRYETTVTEFIEDENHTVTGAVLVKLKQETDSKTKRVKMVPIAGTEEKIQADLVLIAAGFLGPEGYIMDEMGVECDYRSNVKTEFESYKTSVEKVYTAGDMHRGQSLVVWAITEGRNAAKQVDASLMGYSNL